MHIVYSFIINKHFRHKYAFILINKMLDYVCVFVCVSDNLVNFWMDFVKKYLLTMDPY